MNTQVERQLIADLLSALEYHTEQTRPIEFSKVAIEAACEYLREALAEQPAQRKPLTDDEIDALRLATGYAAGLERFTAITRAIEAAHGIKENT